MPERGRNSKARVATAAGISAVVLVGGGGAVAYGTSRGPATAYVTASAGSHSVLQTLQATGTTKPSSAATVSFAVSGTVATVPVAMGDKVTAGQVLATLDNTALKYALATAQGQVANADLTLNQAETGQVSTASGAGGAGTANKTGTTGVSGTTGTTGTTGVSGTTGTTGTTGVSGSTGTASSKSGTGGTSTSGTVTSKIGSTGTAGSTGTTGTAGSKTGTTGSTTTTKSSSSTASITAAQKVLLTTVHQSDTLLTKTKADLGAATTLCTTQSTTSSTTPKTSSPTPTTSSPTPSATGTATPSATGTATPSATGTATLARTSNIALITQLTTTPIASAITCTQAQALVLNDESQLLTLEQGVSVQETALDKLITSAAASTGTAGQGTASAGTAGAATASVGPAGAGTSSAGKSASGVAPAAKATTGTGSAGTAAAAKTTGATGSTTVAVSAAQLAADQAAVDAANANLVLAQQQLSQAAIVSPFTGVVTSVGLTVGQQATAGSSTTAIDVIDPTGHGVSLSVDVTKIPQVKVGEKATVVPDGSLIPLAATVSYIAAAPATSGSTAYNVQLAFNSDPTTLRDGIQASATITTSQAVNALAIPSSAVNHLGALRYVLVPNGSTAKMQRITVGSVGAIYTQVTSGLTAGQQVVLANPATPIPTSTVTSRVARITGGVTGGSSSSVLGGGSTGIGGGSTGIGGARTGG